MENKDNFKAQTHLLYDIKSHDFVETDNLLQLIKDEKLKEKN